MKSLREKYGDWALITGASSGIGEAFARCLAAEKLNLILVARRGDKLRALKAELEKADGVQILPVELDLAAPEFLPRLIQAVGERPVGVLVNNAGFGLNGYFLENDPAEEARMVYLNCLAPLVLSHHYGRAMMKRKKGAIIVLSSIGANQPTPKNVTYTATKAFDLFLGEGLAYETKKQGIDVLAVLPGVTQTGFQDAGHYASRGRMRSPEDVVRTALRALGRKSSVTDGIGNKVLGFMARRMPRAWAIRTAWSFLNRFSL